MPANTPSDSAPPHRWEGSLAMAGALVAGVALGRSTKLALAGGLLAIAGLRRLTQAAAEAAGQPKRARSAPRRAPLWVPGLKVAPAKEKADCCSGPEKSSEESWELQEESGTFAEAAPALAVPVAAASVAELPAIWEAGRGDPVSYGAIAAQTVWYAMPERGTGEWFAEAPEPTLPAMLPILPSSPSESVALPESLFCLAPDDNLVSLPEIPSFDEAARVADALASAPAAESSAALAEAPANAGIEGVAGSVEPARTEEAVPAFAGAGVLDALRRAAHRSILPQAPVMDFKRGNWVMLAAAVALLLLALALVIGTMQPDGWLRAFGPAAQVAHDEVPDDPLKSGGDATTR